MSSCKGTMSAANSSLIAVATKIKVSDIGLHTRAHHNEVYTINCKCCYDETKKKASDRRSKCSSDKRQKNHVKFCMSKLGARTKKTTARYHWILCQQRTPWKKKITALWGKHDCPLPIRLSPKRMQT